MTFASYCLLELTISHCPASSVEEAGCFRWKKNRHKAAKSMPTSKLIQSDSNTQWRSHDVKSFDYVYLSTTVIKRPERKDRCAKYVRDEDWRRTQNILRLRWCIMQEFKNLTPTNRSDSLSLLAVSNHKYQLRLSRQQRSNIIIAGSCMWHSAKFQRKIATIAYRCIRRLLSLEWDDSPWLWHFSSEATEGEQL